jgi:hypothetical protein
MDSTFGILDAFAFVVFGVLILVAFVIIVSLGKLPGQLARKWGHPQAAAVNATSWIGIATGGLLWPIAFIWAFIRWPATEPAAREHDPHPSIVPEADAARTAALRKTTKAGS